jgi:hypothetical protein
MAKYLIKIPTNCSPEEADRWRAVSAFMQEGDITAAKVNNKTTGLSAVQGKAKVNQYDTTAEYLEDKIVSSNSTTFVQSNDGLGAKEIKVHATVKQQTTEPTGSVLGEFWYDTDATDGDRYNNDICMETGDSLLAESGYYLVL